MAPIPIHKNAPITAAKPDGITPTTASPSKPPPPQPGARPAAPTGPVNTGVYTPTPPAPQPGPTATVVTTETRQTSGPPLQFTHPPPKDSALAGRSTTTATGTALPKPGPTFLNYGSAASPFQSVDAGGSAQESSVGRRSLEHPPGYVQAPDNAPYTAGGGIGGQDGGGSSVQEHGVGATAWGMLSKAGEALKSGEEAVWRAVKGK
ncbi:hypothetical protein T440DRAFT_504454 [Plenodomus tracheiphilus IPT5]|uniref:Uncharacterized protein n=1 Tax=Plenodomus tracheiphilus IPT5 TaxID=1408161 RepID=A0A6A7BKE5_9PLEO|nr:hypothetical protein T440DRAFT_504454 [Plenodomus tracheiphilus IPT5]